MNENHLSAVVLISGNGSNLQAIIDAIHSSLLPLKIEVVISSNAAAFGLQRARNSNLPCQVFSKSDFATRKVYDLALADYVEQYSPQLIILAGFMHVLGNTFLERFPNRIINIHPSLLPKYPGLDTHRLAISEGSFEHGCTIHFVNENVDAGQAIAQAAIKIRAEDTPTTLKERVHQAEHFLYPVVLGWFAQGRVQLINNQVLLDNVPVPQYGIKFTINPT